MGVTIRKGNIFNSQQQTIVNTVNCVGVMGKGIALVYKLRYPLMFDIYKRLCDDGLIAIGKLWLYKGDDPSAPWVLNFPTKYHWKYPSKIEFLEKGLTKFMDVYKEKGITSVAFPVLGAANGGLDKDEVLKLMDKYLSRCDIPIEIWEYDSSVPDDLYEKFKDKWNQIPVSEVRELTGIRTRNQVETIADAINSNRVNSMIALISYKGIGIKTMEKCFNLVMKSKPSNTLF